MQTGAAEAASEAQALSAHVHGPLGSHLSWENVSVWIFVGMSISLYLPLSLVTSNNGHTYLTVLTQRIATLCTSFSNRKGANMVYG